MPRTSAIAVVTAAAAAACAATAAFPPAAVVVHTDISLSVNGHSGFDRTKYFNVHGAPQGGDWEPSEIAEFENGLNASLGRSFVFSSTMAQVREDPARPGYVDPAALEAWCKAHHLALSGWSEDHVDLIHSSKTAQLYANGCGGGPPGGFVPGSHNATGDFFARFFRHCMMPTARDRYLIEVANECNVKTQRCNTTFEEMIGAHVAVADALHAIKPAPAVAPRVFGPTLAYPAYQLRNFTLFDDVMGAFIRGAGRAVDGISVHLYDTYDADLNLFSPRSGSNVDAILDLQEAYSLASVGRVLPALVSEHGSGFRDKDMPYAPLHDWLVMRGVSAQAMQLMARPSRVVKSVPFIVGKATWDPNTKANATYSYPWVLWRWDEASKTWHETFLRQFYSLWQSFRGARVAASSDDANVLVVALADSDEDNTFRLALHNLRTVDSVADLTAYSPAPFRPLPGFIARLSLNTTTQAPQLTNTTILHLPSAVTLAPGETVVFGMPLLGGSRRNVARRRRTLYAPAVLASLARPVTTSFSGAASCGEGERTAGGELRLSLGGDAGAFSSGLIAMQVSLAGRNVPVDSNTALGGAIHVNAQDNSAFGALRLPVPASVLGGSGGDVTLTVAVPGDAGANLTLAAAVLDVDCDKSIIA